MSGDQEHEMSLIMPFVVCQSKGGPYDDLAFAAGYGAGHIAARLEVAGVLGTDAITYPIVRRELLPQLELIGMHFGFPVIDVSEPSHEVPGSDEWCSATFRRKSP